MLLLLVIAAIGIFLATFDADRYRPRLIAEAENALGRPVALERLSLGWSGGIALRLQGLAIYEGPGPSGEPLIRVESASALVRFKPLLRKSVQISSIMLNRPQVRVSRDAQGRMNLTGLAAAGAPAAASQSASQPEAVSFQIDHVRLTDGTIHWIDAMVSPPKELWVRALDVSVAGIAPGQPMDVEVSAAVAEDRPNVRASGRVLVPDGGRSGSIEQFSLALDRLPLEPLQPAADPGAPKLHGLLTTSLEGSLPTLDLAQLMGTMSATGTLKLEEGTITNVNILRELFTRLSVIPGLVEKLQSRLPEDYRAKLQSRDTVLKPIELPIHLQSGALRLDRIDIGADAFSLSGSGTVSLAGTTTIQGVARIDKTFSTAIIQSVHELQGLTNAAGELEIPLTIQGQGTRIVPMPDLNYIASKVIVNKVVDVLGQLLDRGEEEETPPGTAPPQDGTQQAPSSEADPLGQLLHRALQRHLPRSEPAPQQPPQQ